MIAQAISTARAAGAHGPILVRGDCACDTRAVVGACVRHVAQFPLVMTRNAAVQRTMADTAHAVARRSTLRRPIVNVPARLVRPQRRPGLHLPTNWPWSKPWLALWRKTIGSSPPHSATT